MGTLFSTSAVEERSGFEALPPSIYKLVVGACEFIQYKTSGDGFKLQFIVDAPGTQYHGRRIFSLLTLSHHNEEFQKGAHQRLADFCYAIGLDGFDSVSDFCQDVLGREFNGKVSVKNEEYNGETRVRNDVANYWTLEGQNRSKVPMPKLSKPQPPTAKVNNDDLPF